MVIEGEGGIPVFRYCPEEGLADMHAGGTAVAKVRGQKARAPLCYYRGPEVGGVEHGHASYPEPRM